jgi:Glutamate-cysteine ligase family 2(GCS2)
VGECSRSMVEINTLPARTIADLAGTYLSSLDLALRAGRELDIRLYPLATYPLPITPSLRCEMSYELQAHTIGRARFLHAARCAGVHLHLELPSGTIDPDSVVSRDAPPAAREELLNLYNLGTALDPALVALTRASPFYEGLAPGLAVRTAFYRGSALFGWEGLYTNLPEVGSLRPYARSVEELVERQLAGYRAWLRAMDRAGVEERFFFETGGNALKASWNPVRPNGHGTVELRGIDSNYPRIVLAVAALVHGAASKVREERLTIEPDEQTYSFRIDGGRLFVPSFGYLSKSLFHAAATSGVESTEIQTYLDSILAFAGPDGSGLEHFAELRSPGGSYKTTESEILKAFPRIALLSTDGGLRLVRESCDELEVQVLSLRREALARKTYALGMDFSSKPASPMPDSML